MKKFFSLICLLSLFATAYGATDYGITVNGTKITSSKTSFTIGSGMVVYDVSHNTLTLTNVIFNCTGSGQSGIAVSATSTRSSSILRIYFEGVNSITASNGSAISCADKTDLVVVGTTVLTAKGSGNHALGLLYTDVSINGEGQLQMSSSGGATVAGDISCLSSLTMAINQCVIGNASNLGQRQLSYLKSVTINPSTTTSTDDLFTFKTRVTLGKTGSSSVPQVGNVLAWNMGSNVKIQSPEGTVFSASSQELTNPLTQLYNHDIEIGDEQLKSGYTAIGNFIYGTATAFNNPCAVLITTTKNFKNSSPTYINVPGFVTINGTVRPVYVNKNAFSGITSVNTIRYNFGVIYIGSYAMNGMPNLIKVYLPSSIKGFEANAFAGAGYPTYPLTVCWAALDYNDVAIPSTAFANTSLGISFYAPTVGARLKAESKNEITDYCTTVSTDPVASCDVTVGNNHYVVTGGFLTSSPGEMAIVGCSTNDKTVTINNNNSSATFGGKTYYCTSIAERAFSSRDITAFYCNYVGVKTIGKYAFTLCYQLEHFTFGEGITKIDGGAFSYTGLASVQWDAINCADFSLSERLFFNSASSGGNKITTFNFGDKVQRIPAYLCYDLPKVSKITIPASVTSIGASAFKGCTGLNSVTWNAKSVADFTDVDAPFVGLTDISSFAFGSNVSKIPAYLCQGMNITSLTVPKSTTAIGRYAFKDCKKLKRIYPQMTAPENLTYGSGIFDGVDKETCYLIVPGGTVSKYKATDPWRLFYNILQDGTGITGDINADGVVNVTDVTTLVNMILGTVAMNVARADVDDNGSVNVSDVTALVNIILEQ